MNTVIRGSRTALCLTALMFFLLGFVSAKALDSLSAAAKLSDASDTKTSAVQSDAEATIGTKTRISFIRYYTKDGGVNVSCPDNVSEYLGDNEKDFSANFPEWKTVKFSSEEVTLEKTVDSFGPESYILTTATDESGRETLAVYSFDRDGGKYLYWQYETPAELFEAEELKKLRDGITVKGKEALNVLLQNYEE